MGRTRDRQPEQRERAQVLTDDAIAVLTPVLGSVRAACQAAGRAQASHYRRHRQSPQPPRPVRERKAQSRALSPAERGIVRAVLNSPSFADMAPAAVYHELLDEGVHLCSTSTMYRILHAHDEVRERRRQAVHPARVKPELVAYNRISVGPGISRSCTARSSGRTSTCM